MRLLTTLEELKKVERSGKFREFVSSRDELEEN